MFYWKVDIEVEVALFHLQEIDPAQLHLNHQDPRRQTTKYSSPSQ